MLVGAKHHKFVLVDSLSKRAHNACIVNNKEQTVRELTKLEDLQNTFSDFFKEINGFRPRWMSLEQWNSEAWLEQAIQSLHDEANAHQNECMKTFAGREHLRAEGWYVPDETDPVLAQHAKWLADERKRGEYAY